MAASKSRDRSEHQEPIHDLADSSRLQQSWRPDLPRFKYRVSGTLTSGSYRLVVQRTNLSRLIVDQSTMLESCQPAADVAFEDLAKEAAKWLLMPADMEAGVP